MTRDQRVPPPAPSLCRHRLNFCKKCDAASGRKIHRGLPGTCPPGSQYPGESFCPAAQSSLAYRFLGLNRSPGAKNPIAHPYLKGRCDVPSNQVDNWLSFQLNQGELIIKGSLFAFELVSPPIRDICIFRTVESERAWISQ